MQSRLKDTPVADYLARLDTKLVKMPPEKAGELRDEIGDHLDSLAAAYEELGSLPDEAMESALRQFGDPAKLGRKLIAEWRRSTLRSWDPNHWWYTPGYSAFSYAYVWGGGTVAVGMLPALVLGAFQVFLNPAGSYEHLMHIPFAGLALSPLAAGWMTGRKMPEHALRGTLPALIALAVPVALLSFLGDGGPGTADCAAVAAWIVSGCLSAIVSRRWAHGKSGARHHSGHQEAKAG